MFLVLLALVSVVFGESLNCDGFTDISLAHGPVSIPASGAIGKLPLGVNQNCTWKISIPTGQYATLKVISQIPSNGVFMIYNSGRSYSHRYSSAGLSDLPAALNTTFYLPPETKGVFIQLATKGTVEGFFSFTAELHNIPNLPTVNQKVSAQIMVDLAVLTKTVYVFESVPMNTFLFRVATPAPDFRYDSCFIFNGPNPHTDTFLTGLSSQVEGIPVRLLGPIAVLCLGTNFAKATLIATPPPDSMNRKSSWTIRTGDKITAQLDGLIDSSGNYPYPSYLTTYCAGGCVEYLQSTASLTKGSRLTLYFGTPVDQLRKVESFLIDLQALYSPQRMSGTWKTYVVDGSLSAYLTINKDRNGGWEVAKEGRKGVFETTAYGQISTLQNTSAVFTPSSKRMLTFQCTVLDFNSTTDYLLVTADQGSGNTRTTKITSKGPLSETVKGYSLKLDYVQGSQLSAGGLFQFEMTASSGSLSMLLIFVGIFYLLV